MPRHRHELPLPRRRVVHDRHLAAITYGKPGKGLKKALKNQLSVIEDEYIKDLKDWNGDVSLFADCTTNLVKIILQSTAKSRSEAD